MIGVIITIRYQDNLRKSEIEEDKNINIRVIDNVTERTFGSLFFFATWFLEEEKISRKQIEMFRREFIKYKRASKDVHDVPLKVIPAKFFPEYTHNRDLIGIIEVELADILENNKISDIEIKKRLTDIMIFSRTKWIIKNHINFIMDDKRKEERVSLLKEFDELEKEYKKSEK